MPGSPAIGSISVMGISVTGFFLGLAILGSSEGELGLGVADEREVSFCFCDLEFHLSKAAILLPVLEVQKRSPQIKLCGHQVSECGAFHESEGCERVWKREGQSAQ